MVPPQLLPQLLLVFQMAASFVAWSLVAWTLVLPAIATWPRRRVLLVLTIPQLFRHLGTTQLSPMVGAARAATAACVSTRRAGP